MSVFPTTSIFMIRDLCRAVGQVVDPSAPVAGQVVAACDELLADHGPRFVQALRTANAAAWRALEVALAGAPPAGFDWAGIDRAKCLAEVQQARASGLLDAGDVVAAQVRGYATRHDQYADPAALAKSNLQTLDLLAKAIKAKLPELARLLLQEAKAGESLVVLAARYFFRQALEADATLSKAVGVRLDQGTPAQEQLLRSLAAGRSIEPTTPSPPRAAPTPGPGAGSPLVAEVEQLLAKMQTRFDPVDLEKAGAMLRELCRVNDPKIGSLLRQARQLLAKVAPPEKLTFLPRADGRAVAVPGRAAALAWSILFSLWEGPASP